MSLLGVMSGGNSFRKIHVDEIRNNALNFYAHINDEDEEIYVADTAHQLSEVGQDMNVLVYEDDSGEDGKRYTLLSGERRWKATKLNYSKGIGDGMLSCKITTKPENENDEQLRIIMGNSQRHKSKNVRKMEIDVLSAVWETLSREERPSGGKRAWISGYIGLSPRQIGEYLTGTYSQCVNEEQTEEELSSAEKQLLENISKNMRAEIERPVKLVAMKNNKIRMEVNADDLFDFLTVMNIFSVQEGLNGLCNSLQSCDRSRDLNFSIKEGKVKMSIVTDGIDDMIVLLKTYGFDSEGKYTG